MHTKESSGRVLQDVRHTRGGEDLGGIPVVAGLTFLMLVVLLVALGYLFFTAPSAGFPRRVDQSDYSNSRFYDFQGQKPGATALPSQQGPTIDENPMSRSGTAYVPTK